MYYKIMTLLAVVFIGLWSSPLEARRHCHTQVSISFNSCTPMPIYREAYVVRPYCEPCYPCCPPPRIYVRPLPPPPPVYYQDVYIYPARPVYQYPYGW